MAFRADHDPSTYVYTDFDGILRDGLGHWEPPGSRLSMGCVERSDIASDPVQ